MKFIRDFKSPNFSSRKEVPIDTFILHHTGGSFQSGVNWMCNSESKVSAHYIGNKDGLIYQLVDDNLCAWHAGRSAFDYNKDDSISNAEKYLNRRSIGYELVSDGQTYTDEQMMSLWRFCILYLFEEHPLIEIERVLGHKEIAPDRKWDPGNLDMEVFRDNL